MDMQKLLLAGRATKDAELIEGKKGSNFAVFSVAVNRVTTKDGEKDKDVTFYDIVCFGEERAKLVETVVKKGDLVFVEGRPDIEVYMGKDKKPKGQLRVVAEKWQVIK